MAPRPRNRTRGCVRRTPRPGDRHPSPQAWLRRWRRRRPPSHRATYQTGPPRTARRDLAPPHATGRDRRVASTARASPTPAVHRSPRVRNAESAGGGPQAAAAAHVARVAGFPGCGRAAAQKDENAEGVSAWAGDDTGARAQETVLKRERVGSILLVGSAIFLHPVFFRVLFS